MDILITCTAGVNVRAKLESVSQAPCGEFRGKFNAVYMLYYIPENRQSFVSCQPSKLHQAKELPDYTIDIFGVMLTVHRER